MLNHLQLLKLQVACLGLYFPYLLQLQAILVTKRGSKSTKQANRILIETYAEEERHKISAQKKKDRDHKREQREEQREGERAKSEGTNVRAVEEGIK